MYHFIVGRKVKSAFMRVTSGDTDAFFERIAPTFSYTFSGANAIGGTRSSEGGMRRWFQRLFHLFPRIEMQVHDVVVSGWPWNTVVVLEWSDRATPCKGAAVCNSGVHVFHLRWGRITRIHAYLDTQTVADACHMLAAAGESEAAQPPIEG
jgi:ketosteroid isomerase-like protein